MIAAIALPVRRDLEDALDASPTADALRDRFVRLADGELDRSYRLAGLILGNAADAEDAVGDALEHAWREIGALREPDHFQAWFDRILVNGCRDRLRRRQRVRFLPLDGSDAHIVDAFRQVLDGDEALRAMAGLPEEERIIVVLHFWADLTLTAVAERLDSPLGTVKSRLHRALERMRAAAASTQWSDR